jgi:glutaredoxin
MFIAEQLNFDVAGIDDELFDEDPVIPKGRARLGLGAGEALGHLVAGLQGHAKPSHESYHTTASPIKDLDIVVFVMQGCVYCDKLKAMLAQHGVDKQVEFVDARDPKHRQELAHVRGFPHYKSKKTGKSSTGYPGSLEKMIASLE